MKYEYRRTTQTIHKSLADNCGTLEIDSNVPIPTPQGEDWEMCDMTKDNDGFYYAWRRPRLPL